MKKISYSVIIGEDPFQCLSKLVEEERGGTQAKGEALVQLPGVEANCTVLEAGGMSCLWQFSG